MQQLEAQSTWTHLSANRGIRLATFGKGVCPYEHMHTNIIERQRERERDRDKQRERTREREGQRERDSGRLVLVDKACPLPE